MDESKGKIRVMLYQTPKYLTQAEVKASGPVVPEEAFEEISVVELENDLRELLNVFEKLWNYESKYCVDEAKTTWSVSKDIKGNVHFGFSAKILGLFGIEAGGEVEAKSASNELFEIKIKRKGSS